MWSLLGELLWLNLRQTLAAAESLRQLQFDFVVFCLLHLLLPWVTFHHGSCPFHPGLFWHLGTGLSLSLRSIHTKLCASLCLHVRVLMPYSSWKQSGQAQWPPVLHRGCCREIRAALSRQVVRMLCSQSVVFWQPGTAGAWGALHSCSCVLSVLVPSFGVSLLCSPQSLGCSGCRPWGFTGNVLSVGSA